MKVNFAFHLETRVLKSGEKRRGTEYKAFEVQFEVSAAVMIFGACVTCWFWWWSVHCVSSSPKSARPPTRIFIIFTFLLDTLLLLLPFVSCQTVGLLISHSSPANFVFLRFSLFLVSLLIFKPFACGFLLSWFFLLSCASLQPKLKRF